MVDNKECSKEFFSLNWKDKSVPLLDSIMFCDGRVIVLDLSISENDNSLNYSLSPLVDTNLASFFKYNPDQIVTLEPKKTAENSDVTYQAVCGGSTYEGDGFVALCSHSKEKILWIIFLQNISEFTNVYFNQNEIGASADDGMEICIPIDSPENAYFR